MNYEVGTQIGDYQILAVLGTGGMGKVYKVRNVISDRVEAMKILLPDLANQQALADRFLREIKVLASLNHPNIAALHTALRVENQLLMIMELVEGVTLGDKLQAGPIPLKETLAYMDQALSALSYAHRQGVIHRDIKPANMMLTLQGVLKLMDFGIARAPSDSKLTMTGTTLGSLHYMSPEQVKGGPLDARSDLYSLGIVFYEVVTGKRPFQEASEYSVMAAHLEKAPQPPIEINSALPEPLNAVILLSLAKDPAQRFQSADAFRAALANVAGTPVPGLAAAVPATPPAAGIASSFGMPQAVPAQHSPISPPVTQPAKSGGYRGFYMALGALLVVIVIVASAIELPRWMKTRAGEKTPATASTQAQVPPEQSQPAASGLAASAATASPVITSSTTAQPPLSNAGASNPGTSASVASNPEPSSPKVTSTRPAKKLQHFTPKSQAVSNSGTPGAAAPASGSPAGNVQETAETPPSTTSSPDASASQQGSPIMQDLQDRMDKLSSRASAVDQSLKALQQQQANSGFTMRGDVSSSWIRMKGFMDRADRAISTGHPLVAKHSMDLAEREVDFLEKFLGR